jgi:hypothetical protein
MFLSWERSTSWNFNADAIIAASNPTLGLLTTRVITAPHAMQGLNGDTPMAKA